jgi:UDP-N-acetylglucosamine 2-epimerase (non-hydrolysing)
MHVLHVVGARPNFMKVAPVMAALADRDGTRQTLVHTGQHGDANMSAVFFRQLGIPEPDINLEVGSGSHAGQTAMVMQRFEEVVLRERPDRVLVYGDVNSTLAAALVCAKLLVPVDHVEAGLRSRDRTMPEEVNRVVTDQVCDLLFTPSADADANLAAEGVEPERVHRVGNVMIDTLVRSLPMARAPLGVRLPDRFALVTLHRPSNVDDSASLRALLAELLALSSELPVVFPVHPRTRLRISEYDLKGAADSLILLEPQGYLEFLHLQQNAVAVITDSGGVQEETTYLRVPCLTVRENTERPVTVTHGSNVLVGRDLGLMRRELEAVLQGRPPRGGPVPLWDGRAAERVADALLS